MQYPLERRKNNPAFHFAIGCAILMKKERGRAMERIRYHKLVRDRIPEIIRAGGGSCVTETLTEADYITMLDLKLTEELNEYQESKSLEELADLLEVMHAVAEARGSSMAEVEAIRLRKREDRGGFAGRLMLTEVVK